MPELDDKLVTEEVVSEVKKEEVKEEREESSEEEEEEKAEEKAEEKEEESTEEENLEVSQALELFNALKGPNGRAVVANLARRAGLIKDEEFTDISEAKKIKSVKGVIKEALGDEYSFLADKLGNALDQVLSEQLSTIESKFAESAKVTAEREADSALESITKKYKDFTKFESRIYKLMQSMPFTGKGSLTMADYLENLYVIAKNNAGNNTSSLVKTVEKMKENAQDANLVSSDVSSNRVKRGPAKPTLNEAIEAAAKGIKFA